MTPFLNSQSDIIEWLHTFNSEKRSTYTILANPDQHSASHWVVDVTGDVRLISLQLDFIPVKFSHVRGNFLCNANQLTGLDFAPNTLDGHFNISNNQITSLKGCPSIVGGSFFCFKNCLTSLQFSPSTVGSHFRCGNNLLTNLEFCPDSVGGLFDCSNNQIESLEFFPNNVGNQFFCLNNPLLGDIQNTYKFSDALRIHIQYVEAKREKESFEQLLKNEILDQTVLLNHGKHKV